MFTKNDSRFFMASCLLLFISFAAVAFDPVENGFGWLTLWLAPPLIILGLLLIFPGLLGRAAHFSLKQLVNNDPVKHVAGLGTFVFSLSVYLFTLEPTASLWDCSEFIATAFKLQVPHTPGTPLSLLIGRLFSMLSFGDVTKVAWTMNFMSALFSAATVFIWYHLIYYFAQSCFPALNRKRIYVISAFCGCLCMAFSDTFWFSAVEAETYGAACFFISLLLLLIIKGLAIPAGSRKHRWMVLIFYVAGLGYCIHPMCLLVLPVLPLSWMLENGPITLKRIFLAMAIGVTLILFINRFVAVGIVEVSFWLDLLFVNSFHFPFYSGAIFFAILFVAGVVWLIRNYQPLQPYVYAAVFLLVGFSPYAMMFLRSGHNPPIDESNPENLPLVKAYMNREGYPTRPLLYGPYFDAEITAFSKTKDVYYKGDQKYSVAGSLSEYNFDQSRETILPRIYSNDEDHIASYRRWTGLKENEKPKFIHNLQFMLRYQLGHMYWRYLMYNFSGRESDIQNTSWLKPWEPMYNSSSIDHSKARNQYWMIPLLLGIIGILVQWRNDKRSFAGVAALFLLTGVVLVLYLNSTPNEPRERDYIYVGSYMAFTIWIGLGAGFLLNRIKDKAFHTVAVSGAVLLPLWMLHQNYNDHDRSGRTFQIDHARNILSSCAPNSILFTGGDNDTFPLWYLQEVEGWRTDVRVMVLSYLNTDWYINQLRKTYYDSQAFNLTLNKDAYRQYGPNDALYVQDQIKDGITADKYLELLNNAHPALQLKSSGGDAINLLPSKTIRIPTPVLLASTTQHQTDKKDTSERSSVAVKVTSDYLYKNSLAILDILTSNIGRPVYFNFTSQNQIGLSLQPYLVQEGEVYRFDPSFNDSGTTRINTDQMYVNLIQKSDYKNLLDDGINFNYEDFDLRMISPLRQSFNTLAAALLEEGDESRAGTVLDHALKYLHGNHLTPTFTNLQTADLLVMLKRKEDAIKISARLFDFTFAKVSFDLKKQVSPGELDVYLLKSSAELLAQLGEDEYLLKFEALRF